MVYRDRQNDPQQSSKNRDRYLDNCFLLCINRDDDDDVDIPEIHRLENNFMKELCNKNSLQQQQRGQISSENYDFDDDEFINPRQQKDRDYSSRRKVYQTDKNSQITNRSRYRQDENYYDRDQYLRNAKFNPRDDYNIMQHSDDELSVYEVYIPTNTLNRLSDKRIDNNMVLIDYEDASKLRDMRGPSTRNLPSQYNNYKPSNQYPYDISLGYPRERDNQQQFYQNNPSQQRFAGYYGNENDRQAYPPQSNQVFPTNVQIDHSNAINVRRHIYSPSQLPQGLTEGQLVMLLQKGNQYQQIKPEPIIQQTPFVIPTQNEPQPTTTASAVTVSQKSPVSSIHAEPFKNPEYAAQTKTPQVPPQIIDHKSIDENKSSDIDEITKPMSTLSPIKPVEEKKKDKKETDDGGDKKESKKESKKEKSSGKDGKKKKK